MANYIFGTQKIVLVTPIKPIFGILTPKLGWREQLEYSSSDIINQFNDLILFRITERQKIEVLNYRDLLCFRLFHFISSCK